MDNLIIEGDRQLVILYKDYRLYNDPSYEFKNTYFNHHQNRGLGTDTLEDIFDALYKEHIANGNLVLKDLNDNVITNYFGISGRFLVSITSKGVNYVEQKYPFLL